MRTILLLLAVMLAGCGTFKTVNNPYGKKQLVWARTSHDGLYIINNYYSVTKEFYSLYRVGDEFSFSKGDILGQATIKR